MNLEVVKSYIFLQPKKNIQLRTPGFVLLISVIDIFSSTDSLLLRRPQTFQLSEIRVPSVAQ